MYFEDDSHEDHKTNPFRKIPQPAPTMNNMSPQFYQQNGTQYPNCQKTCGNHNYMYPSNSYIQSPYGYYQSPNTYNYNAVVSSKSDANIHVNQNSKAKVEKLKTKPLTVIDSKKMEAIDLSKLDKPKSNRSTVVSSNSDTKIHVSQNSNPTLWFIDPVTARKRDLTLLKTIKNQCLYNTTPPSNNSDTDLRETISPASNNNVQRKIYNGDSLLKIGQSERSLKLPSSLDKNCDVKEIISKEVNMVQRMLENKKSKRIKHIKDGKPTYGYYFSFSDSTSRSFEYYCPSQKTYNYDTVVSSKYDANIHVNENTNDKVYKTENGPFNLIDPWKVATSDLFREKIHTTKCLDNTIQLSDDSETDLRGTPSLFSNNIARQMFNSQRKIYNRDSLLEIGKSERSRKLAFSLDNCDLDEIISKEVNEVMGILENKVEMRRYGNSNVDKESDIRQQEEEIENLEILLERKNNNIHMIDKTIKEAKEQKIKLVNDVQKMKMEINLKRHFLRLFKRGVINEPQLGQMDVFGHNDDIN